MCQSRLRQKGSELGLFVLGLSHRNKALFIPDLGSGSRLPSRSLKVRPKGLLAWRCIHSDMVPTCCEGKRNMLKVLSFFSELWGKGQVPGGSPREAESVSVAGGREK